MLQALRFANSWVDVIMMCVTTIEYMVTQDGHEVGPIILGHGLRHGDPLSPFHFIICAEGLSSILKVYEFRGLIHGCKVARTALIISHLFFENDSFSSSKLLCMNVKRLRNV